MAYSINTQAIHLGACKIWYWDTNGWVAIGATFGGTTITYSPQFYDLKIDQLGETVVKKILQGEIANIRFGIAEQGLAKLQLAIPFGTLYSSGGKQALGVGVNSGGDLLEKTIKLRVHPINSLGVNHSDDESYIENDFIVWKAGNAEPVELPFNPDSPRVYSVTMSIFPDLDQSPGRYLFVIGDPNVTGDSTPPSVNIKGEYPADGATDVPVTIRPRLVISKVLRMLNSQTPNCILNMLKESDHSKVALTVTAEQYIEGTAMAATDTTMNLNTGEIDRDDQFNGLYVELTEGTGAKPGTLISITDSTAANDQITVASWPNGTPDNTTKYRIHATRITIAPTSNLLNNTQYNIIVTNMIDLAGNIQQNVFETSFTTAV